MSRRGFHILREDDVTIVTRHLPPRFDIHASAEFPYVSPVRLAQQIRQDLWRMLQKLRGFSPVVRVEQAGDALVVTAGGRVMKPVRNDANRCIAALLHDAARRKRWIDWARERAQ